MLRREPTRIELKPDDKEEYERQKQAAATSPAQRPQATTPSHAAEASKTPATGDSFASYHGASGDEVEIKLRLADKAAHDRLADALRPGFRETHAQENFFFDGARQELSGKRTVVRCRFYNKDKRALLTIKGQQMLSAGVGRGSEVEEDVDPIAARAWLEDPEKLRTFDSKLLQPLLQQNGVERLVCLGGFENERSDFDWEGFKLELDTTRFPWGTVHEVEVETEAPEELKPRLEAFLRQHGVQYKYSTTTKFANFVNKTLL